MITNEQLKILKDKNIPFIKTEYEYIKNVFPEKDNDYIFKKYCAIMKLPAFKYFTFDDSEELKQIPVKFQAGKDNEANSIITSLADLIDNICHTASLSALFPQKFEKIKIEGKTFVEFFADLSPVLKDFEQAIESKDTVLLGDLAEYEISPRLDSLADALEA